MSERQFFLVYNLCLEKVCDGRKLIKSLKPLLISLYFTAKRGNMCKDLLKHANINRTAYMAFAIPECWFSPGVQFVTILLIIFIGGISVTGGRESPLWWPKISSLLFCR